MSITRKCSFVFTSRYQGKRCSWLMVCAGYSESKNNFLCLILLFAHFFLVFQKLLVFDRLHEYSVTRFFSAFILRPLFCPFIVNLNIVNFFFFFLRGRGEDGGSEETSFCSVKIQNNEHFRVLDSLCKTTFQLGFV